MQARNSKEFKEDLSLQSTGIENLQALPVVMLYPLKPYLQASEQKMLFGFLKVRIFIEMPL
jgi:hypothetical protein